MMNIEDIRRLAQSDKEPDDATEPEWLYWFRLREIDRQLRKGNIDKNDAQTQRKDAEMRYDRLCHKLNDYNATMFHTAELWKRIEYAATQYAKHPSVESADRFFEAVYRLKPVHSKRPEDDPGGPWNRQEYVDAAVRVPVPCKICGGDYPVCAEGCPVPDAAKNAGERKMKTME